MGKLKKNSTKIAHSPRQFHQLKDLACPYTNQRRFCSHFSSTEMNKIKGRVMDTYYQAWSQKWFHNSLDTWSTGSPKKSILRKIVIASKPHETKTNRQIIFQLEVCTTPNLWGYFRMWQKCEPWASIAAVPKMERSTFDQRKLVIESMLKVSSYKQC